MNKIAIVYGSTTGNIENSAHLIAEQLDDYDVELFDIAENDFNVDDFDFLIFGISTWEYGGLQEDWIDFFPFFKEMNFNGKICAVFGQGDQEGYDEWFQDGIADVHDVLIDQGATIIGYWPNQGYHFSKSKGLTKDGAFFQGLALDDDNQPELTEQRIQSWAQQIIAELHEQFEACEIV